MVDFLVMRTFQSFDEIPITYVLERFDTSAENPVKEILLKLNLPDHRIFKDGGEGINLQLLLKVNAVRHKLSTAGER
ncbi:hypothetical protein Tco_0888214 [Tanacetum coccineum]